MYIIGRTTKWSEDTQMAWTRSSPKIRGENRDLDEYFGVIEWGVIADQWPSVTVVLPSSLTWEQK